MKIDIAWSFSVWVSYCIKVCICHLWNTEVVASKFKLWCCFCFVFVFLVIHVCNLYNLYKPCQEFVWVRNEYVRKLTYSHSLIFIFSFWNWWDLLYSFFSCVSFSVAFRKVRTLRRVGNWFYWKWWQELCMLSSMFLLQNNPRKE